MQRISFYKKIGQAFVVDGSALVRVIAVDEKRGVKFYIEASSETKIRRESLIDVSSVNACRAERATL